MFQSCAGTSYAPEGKVLDASTAAEVAFPADLPCLLQVGCLLLPPGTCAACMLPGFSPAVLLTLPCMPAGGLPAAVPAPARPPPPYTAACCSCPATTPACTLPPCKTAVSAGCPLPCCELHLVWLPSTGRHLLLAVQRLPPALRRGSRGVPAGWRGNRGGAARAGGKGAPALHGHREGGAAACVLNRSVSSW